MNRALVPGHARRFRRRVPARASSVRPAPRICTASSPTGSAAAGTFRPLRVGRQPYGIVVTGAWGNWTFPPHDRAHPTSRRRCTRSWLRTGSAGRCLPAQRRTPRTRAATVSSACSTIIGQLAEFERVRVAQSRIRRIHHGAAELRLAPIRPSHSGMVQRAAADAQQQPRRRSTFPRRPDRPIRCSPSSSSCGRRRRGACRSSIAIPPCRCPRPSPVAPYDGAHNYLWWLTQASRDDLSQRSASSGRTERSGRRRRRRCSTCCCGMRLLAALEAGTLDAAPQIRIGFFRGDRARSADRQYRRRAARPAPRLSRCRRRRAWG